MKNKVATLLLLSIPASLSLAGGNSSRCSEIVPSLSIEFQRVERAEAWGDQIDFAKFKISNKSTRELKFAIGGTDSPLTFHAAFKTLQSRESGSSGLWKEFDPVLDKHFDPTAWLVVGSTGEVTIFSDLVGPMSVPERSRLLEFRLSVRDTLGCEYLSNSFKVVP